MDETNKKNSTKQENWINRKEKIVQNYLILSFYFFFILQEEKKNACAKQESLFLSIFLRLEMNKGNRKKRNVHFKLDDMG